jgi:CRP-like cAMP-binding protein
MHIAQLFYTYLSKFVPLTLLDFEQYIQPIIRTRCFEKKEFVTKAGEVEDYMNFILQGLVRKFYRKGHDEINTQISYEGHIIHAQESFHSRQPSEYFIETLEPTKFISISYDDLEHFYAQDVRFERLGRKVITYTMVQKDRWQMQMVNLGPRERFLYFMERHPTLLQRVPQKHVASFLNIQPETFSRYKHLLRPKKEQS